MLVHVTLTHTEDNCPGYHPEIFKELGPALDRIEDTAKDVGVRIHSFVLAPVEHVMFAVLEAETQSAIAAFCHRIPIRQTAKVTPVESLAEMAQFLRDTQPRT